MRTYVRVIDRSAMARRSALAGSLDRVDRRELGQPASNVAYQAAAYGLRSAHAARLAPKGQIGPDELSALVDQGLSVRQIAERLGIGPTAARHWLAKHGLQTARARRPVPRSDEPEAMLHCRRHGETAFVVTGTPRRHRCKRCRSERLTQRRRVLKRQLVAEAGGRCLLCGYDRFAGALQFHHVDPLLGAEPVVGLLTANNTLLPRPASLDWGEAASFRRAMSSSTRVASTPPSRRPARCSNWDDGEA